MKNLIRCAAAAAVLTMAGLAPGAFAQEGSAALNACVLKSTTAADRLVLLKWLFGAMTSHPDMAPLSNVTAAQRTEMSRQVGKLFTRLLTVDCATEARASSGQADAMEAAGQVLGRAAMQDLMTNPKVQASMGEFGNYVDQKRFHDVLGIQ